MHHRLPVVLVLTLAIVPLSTVLMIGSLTEKQETYEELNRALDDAAASYRSGNGLFSLERKRTEELHAARVALEESERKKHAARSDVVSVDKELRLLWTAYGVDVTNSGALMRFVRGEERRFAEFARYLQTRDMHAAAPTEHLGTQVITRMVGITLGEMTESDMRNRVLQRAKLRVFSAALRAKEAMEQRGALHAAYASALEEYAVSWEDYRDAADALRSTQQRIEDVRRITEEVHAEVLALQGELARIDARLRAKIERELIEKGLMEARPGERSDGAIRSEQAFRWPVIGKISAGFMNAAYERFFGVPHRGVDIVVGQGSPVFAASDGIVFLARDGGETGYSYLLIGHRDGYATLYGHLSSFAVSNGEEVTAGQMIGLSGATPGTHGAGPMTTGAHLHFELIRNGTHMDPLTVLR